MYYASSTVNTPWDVAGDVIETHVNAWLEAVAPAGEEPMVALPSVDDLRESGRRTLSSVVSNARVLVDARLHRHAAGVGNRPTDLRTITEALSVSGAMDFKRITAEDVVAWPWGAQTRSPCNSTAPRKVVAVLHALREPRPGAGAARSDGQHVSFLASSVWAVSTRFRLQIAV
jgi:hypothetical protein